jgi:hypothetical protein
MAAESSAKLAFLFRPESAIRESSPAALRLQLKPGGCHGTLIHIIKCRGGCPPEPVRIPQPFSTFGNLRHQTESSRPRINDQRSSEPHAPTAENSITAALAGHSLPTVIPGPPVPGAKLH